MGINRNIFDILCYHAATQRESIRYYIIITYTPHIIRFFCADNKLMQVQEEAADLRVPLVEIRRATHNGCEVIQTTFQLDIRLAGQKSCIRMSNFAQ